MTTLSLHESMGLSIHYGPALAPSEPVGGTGRLTDAITSYDHEIAAEGGFLSARIGMNLPLLEAEDWFSRGLGRHVQVYNPGMVLVWEGFVNSLSMGAGSLSATRGPLMSIANRIGVNYTRITDTATAPPTTGTQATTPLADDADAQALYGIIEKVVSGGTLLPATALQLRDTYLAENALPRTSEELTLSAGQAASVTLECLGYYAWFKAFIYQVLVGGTVQLSDKLENIITADPNGIFSADYSSITFNGFLVSQYEDDDRFAWDIITDEISIGDAADDRYTFGIYDDRRAVYEAIPMAAAYQHRIADESQRVETATGAEVKPWNVRPAHWIFLPDFLVGRTQPVTLREDPRYLFIESVKYTAPNGLTLTGGDADRLPQLIAKLR